MKQSTTRLAEIVVNISVISCCSKCRHNPGCFDRITLTNCSRHFAKPPYRIVKLRMLKFRSRPGDQCNITEVLNRMNLAEHSAAELTRCVKEFGFKGALVNGFTQKDVEDSAIYYDIPEYRPFWATVEELGVPFYLHPRTQIPSRSQSYEGHPWIVSAAWGFARETSIHAIRLIGSCLFDEYPRLQIVLGHLGERIPYDMWRLDHRIRKSPQGYACKKQMSAYLRENFHLTTSGNFHDATFHCAIAEMGLERIMFSVDYPFEDTVDAASWYDNTEMPDADRLQIGRTNAIKLFKLDMS